MTREEFVYKLATLLENKLGLWLGMFIRNNQTLTSLSTLMASAGNQVV